MELNHILFPAPPTHSKPQDFQNDLMYIPRYYKFSKKQMKMQKNLLRSQIG